MAYADGQGQRACRRDLCAAGKEARVHHADGHALRNVVQRDGQHHHGRAGKPAFGAFGLFAADVQVGDQMVERKQEQHAEPEARKRREERELSQCCRLLDGRDEKAPDRRGYHHACGKARKRTLDQIAERFFHKEHTGRTGRRAEKRDQNPENCLHMSASGGYLFLLYPALSRYSG